jgi:aspartate carbamoyltransferase regulatory subunit
MTKLNLFSSPNPPALPCEYCGKLFSCLNNLRTHLYYHAEPKFVCDFDGCGKKFFMRKLLKSHIKVHQGQKDFDCEYCEKSYFFQAHLKRHVISMHMVSFLGMRVNGSW